MSGVPLKNRVGVRRGWGGGALSRHGCRTTGLEASLRVMHRSWALCVRALSRSPALFRTHTHTTYMSRVEHKKKNMFRCRAKRELLEGVKLLYPKTRIRFSSCLADMRQIHSTADSHVDSIDKHRALTPPRRART